MSNYNINNNSKRNKMACENEYEENVENLQKLLSFNKIISFQIKYVHCAAGSGEGDNYMSVVKRLQISDQKQPEQQHLHQQLQQQQQPQQHPHDSNNAEAANKLSLIIKRQIFSLSRKKLYRCDEAFLNEISAYQHVVPLLEEYLEETCFPKCFFAGEDEHGEIIILEDLKELGYCMQNRLIGLELNYCELVMKQLGKLHAASIAAKQLDNEVFRDKCHKIRDIVYSKEAEEFYSSILQSSIEESLRSLRTSNTDGSLTKPISIIERLQSKLFSHIQHCITNSNENLRVLCHGDLWVNNIMFTTESPPCSVKFFDLQAMRYASVVFDLLHFFYTSTKRDLRDAYMQPLLKTYCSALLDSLEQQFVHCNANDTQLQTLRDTFSLSNITEEYYEHVLYGLAISIWILPAVTFDPNNIPNLDAISELGASVKEINCTQKLTPEYHMRLRDLALEFYQNGYLNSIVCDE